MGTSSKETSTYFHSKSSVGLFNSLDVSMASS
jgi:hypothetical protein